MAAWHDLLLNCGGEESRLYWFQDHGDDDGSKHQIKILTNEISCSVILAVAILGLFPVRKTSTKEIIATVFYPQK